jgi:hypothetical protein
MGRRGWGSQISERERERVNVNPFKEELMFRCENAGCEKNVSRRQPVNKVVTERREKQYEHKPKSGPNKGKIELRDGWEIAKEISVCPECFVSLTGKEPLRYVEPVTTQAQSVQTSETRKKRPWVNPAQRKSKNKRKPSKEGEKRKPIVEVINRMPRDKNDKQPSRTSKKSGSRTNRD